MGQKKNLFWLGASLSGEMRPEDIPPAAGVDVDLIKAGDPDPLEVVVAVPAGRSTRGWNYTPGALKEIVDTVNSQTLSGIMGHQRPENLANDFVEPVTHWIGAKMVGETAYFRGIIDADAKKLKRWIRSGRIKQVSIFGAAQLSNVSGETNVIHYKAMSIDWTPLDRAGMPTRIVALGEMDDPDIEGGNPVDWKQLIAQLQSLISAGTANLADILAELDPNGSKQATTNAELIGKLRTALGISENDDLLAAADKAAKALAAEKQASTEELASEVVKSKVNGEMAQDLVLRMLRPAEGATKEQIVGELDALLATPNVKDMISKFYTDTAILGGGQSGAAVSSRKANI